MRLSSAIALSFGIVVALACSVEDVNAQQAVQALRGRVLDTRRQPVEGASVSVVGTFWRTSSAADGAFRIGLPGGTWTLRVQRIGYQTSSRTIGVSAGTDGDSVVFVLDDAPGVLGGVVITADRNTPFASTIEASSIRNAPALAEADIFRLLPLLPSVSQPNDLIGRVHLAGGASDEHMVRLDGHPLQSPFHVMSVLGAFNVAALDRADVLIHHLPSSKEGELSGAIDLSTKRVSSRAAEVAADARPFQPGAGCPSFHR